MNLRVVKRLITKFQTFHFIWFWSFISIRDNVRYLKWIFVIILLFDLIITLEGEQSLRILEKSRPQNVKLVGKLPKSRDEATVQ